MAKHDLTVWYEEPKRLRFLGLHPGGRESMEPTIRSGDLVTVDEHAYDHRLPARGEIVAVIPPAGAGLDRCGVRHPRGSACPRPTRAVG
jgi:hypothetical protein